MLMLDDKVLARLERNARTVARDERADAKARDEALAVLQLVEHYQNPKTDIQTLLRVSGVIAAGLEHLSDADCAAIAVSRARAVIAAAFDSEQ